MAVPAMDTNLTSSGRVMSRAGSLAGDVRRSADGDRRGRSVMPAPQPVRTEHAGGSWILRVLMTGSF